MFQSQMNDLRGVRPSVLLNVQVEGLSAVLEPPEKRDVRFMYVKTAFKSRSMWFLQGGWWIYITVKLSYNFLHILILTSTITRS